jgi:hypothetical protein
VKRKFSPLSSCTVSALEIKRVAHLDIWHTEQHFLFGKDGVHLFIHGESRSCILAFA